ncbi:outer membrane beta-barrel protein [Sediminibacterium ginsengisoli]|uniref:Outer membrane receptor proteins, mostly Fe transport n=1 Tax=Sediminibacterium ginsengisoli TaxID=413434 RepID=A0A1T4K9W6_9BACT|nr:outer membrane beta-barrel protein [Sediminibacterium ginsengisoli]SJZ39201.1 Outer membrane receptor proteins, mostly Fe transport [Sediminibacterium ginsengisoli]
MKKNFLAVLGLLISLCTFSQSGTISGKLMDSASGKALPLATVTVFKALDTAIITYRLSNPEGDFKVPGLPLNVPLRMIATFSGYGAVRKEFTLTAEKNNLQLDTLRLSTTSKLLDEVIVISERPPVVIKNDTVEFNASAFKTLPNALVEDLLKKLPGVQVDADGNITVNGKAVNRILVDGKTFFGSDPKMASRNLPANVIDKVQVVDDKEELLRNGDDNMNNVGKVVNITLKKGVKKGMFGKVYAGAGDQERYEAGAIANIFRDTLQVSLLGYVNNLNRPGFSFTELMQTAGLERSNSNLNSRSTSIWNNGSGSGISVNGISFGGSQNTGGIAASKGLGININHAPSSKQSLFAQYFYGNILIDRINESDVSQYRGDSIIRNSTVVTGDVVNNAHNIGIGGKFNPDSVTTIMASANYTIGLSDEDRFSNIASTHNLLGPLSNGLILQNNESKTYYYRHNFTYTRASKTKKGRRISISHNLDINNNFTDFTTNSNTHYIYPVAYDTLLAQLRSTGVPKTNANVGVLYSEPLNKNLIARFGSRYEYSKLNNNINTFNPNAGNTAYDVPNPALSSTFNRESHYFYVSGGLEWKLKELYITPTLRWQIQNIDNIFSGFPIKQNRNDLLPVLSIRYKTLNLNYSKDISLPFYTYLMPVTDNTNPYFISKGNANLLPAERHNISLNYFVNNTKRNLSVGANGGGSFSKSDVIQEVTVDNKGIQTNVPVNADGTDNFWLNYNINKQYKNNQKFIVSWNMGAYYSYNRSQLLYNGAKSWQKSFQINQWAGFNMNFNDKLELNASYSLNNTFTRYTSSTFTPLNVVTHYVNTEAILRYPKHVIWETNINYSYNGSLQGGLPKDITRWNAAVNFTMLKDEKGVLRIGVNDILDKFRSISMYASGNRTTISRTNVLGRYFMATFTYNIRAIGAKKKVGGDKLFLF